MDNDRITEFTRWNSSRVVKTSVTPTPFDKPALNANGDHPFLYKSSPQHKYSAEASGMIPVPKYRFVRIGELGLCNQRYRVIVHGRAIAGAGYQ